MGPPSSVVGILIQAAPCRILSMWALSFATSQPMELGPSLSGATNFPSLIQRHSVDLLVPNTAKTVGILTKPSAGIVIGIDV
jgi:hypothetical protein